MVRETFNMQTELVTSEDGLSTYEVRRKWAEGGKKGLVLELYPTISAGHGGELDMSTMHLLNHVSDFGWSECRIINLYSSVFQGKPSTSLLDYDGENMAYIEEIIEKGDLTDCDIVIATGNSLSTHTATIEEKIDIFTMLQKRGLGGQVKCMVAEGLDTKKQIGVHPLFLGLHFGKAKWRLVPFPLKSETEELEKSLLKPKERDGAKTASKEAEESAVKENSAAEPVEEAKKGSEKRSRKKEAKSVLQDKA